MRRNRERASLVLLIALLLPLVLGLMPQAAFSAQAQFDRDVAASLCAPESDGQDQDRHAGHDACCILCPAGSSVPVALRASAQPALPLLFRRADSALTPADPVPGLRADLARIVPRGPPIV